MDRLETIDEVVDAYCVASSPSKSKLYVGIGSILLVFAFVGIWVPGLPTVSFAVPAAFLFSLSSERMFRLTLTNRFFGEALFEYYATGKTIPAHAKYTTIAMIGIMTALSSYFVWYVSTKGEGAIGDPASWNGPDPGFGAVSIILVGLLGMWYVGFKVPSRR
ncbi:MAG: DUF454 family protein [Candidatus Thermoplasmatota archaeon]|jgi:hypothetical protein|nr:DUF454 family protein [Candidatus Thermoplasmatota archaeon]